MIRKFRAIIQTSKEPEDHEVLWYWRGKLLYWENGEWQPFHIIDLSEIPYDDIHNTKEFLDKLVSGQLPVYIKGVFEGEFIDNEGKNLAQEINRLGRFNDTKFANIRDLLQQDNLLNNPYFAESLKYWQTELKPEFLKAGDSWIIYKGVPYIVKSRGANIITENNRNMLILTNGYIEQTEDDMKKIVYSPSIPHLKKPYKMRVIINCNVDVAGSLKVEFSNEHNHLLQLLNASTEDQIVHTEIDWDGTGNFILGFTGSMKVKSIILKVDELGTFYNKYEELFSHKDTLVSMAIEEENKIEI